MAVKGRLGPSGFAPDDCAEDVFTGAFQFRFIEAEDLAGEKIDIGSRPEPAPSPLVLSAVRGSNRSVRLSAEHRLNNFCGEGGLGKLLIALLLSCQPGHRLIDWSGQVPSGVFLADILVTVEPFYTRLSIYQPGRFESIWRCCNGRQASVVRVPIENGKFCVAQSQPQMKWTLRLSFKQGLEL